jgi:hypothetical protein
MKIKEKGVITCSKHNRPIMWDPSRFRLVCPACAADRVITAGGAWARIAQPFIRDE